MAMRNNGSQEPVLNDEWELPAVEGGVAANRVLSQEIVSTPEAKFERVDKRLEVTDIVINIRILLLEMSKGG